MLRIQESTSSEENDFVIASFAVDINIGLPLERAFPGQSYAKLFKLRFFADEIALQRYLWGGS